jgi:hypothetical protein
MTIQLLSASAANLPGRQRQNIPLWPLAAAMVLVCITLGYRRSTGRIVKSTLVFASIALACTFIVACNAGFAGKPGTLPGNYTITITGTSGALQRSTTITLVVS